MNMQHLLNRSLRGLGTGLAAAALAVTLAGCSADSNTISGPGGGGGGGGGGSGPADLENCDVIVTTLCVLGGPNHGHGLIDELLSPTGPLGPIAGEINAEDLVEPLRIILMNDDGDLPGLLQASISEGRLQEGLQLLLLGDDDGNGGLANALQALLAGDETGGGIVGLVGENGLQGLIEALANGTSSTCQAPLGTICLVEGEGSNQRGLLDLILRDESGALYALSDHLDQDTLLDILGDTLESNGSLQDLVTNAIQNGQLAEGLQRLLVGDPDNGVEPGLLQAIQNTLADPPDLITDLIDAVVGILTPGGLG